MSEQAKLKWIRKRSRYYVAYPDPEVVMTWNRYRIAGKGEYWFLTYPWGEHKATRHASLAEAKQAALEHHVEKSKKRVVPREEVTA